MEAQLRFIEDVAVVSISGALDIERTQPFKDVVIREFSTKKLVFNMQNASFVGSTGIQAFLSTLQVLEANNTHGVKLVGVKPEFRRVISQGESQKIEFYDTETLALASFHRILQATPGGVGGSDLY